MNSLGRFVTTGLVLLGAVLGVAGCDSVRSTPGAMSDPQPAEAYPTVAVEAGLQRYVSVDHASVVVDPSTGARPLHVVVPIRSLADNQMRTQYEFTWFDAAGRELGRSGWQFLVLEPRLQRRVSGNSLSSQATKWRLELRSAR